MSLKGGMFVVVRGNDLCSKMICTENTSRRLPLSSTFVLGLSAYVSLSSCRVDNVSELEGWDKQTTISSPKRTRFSKTILRAL